MPKNQNTTNAPSKGSLNGSHPNVLKRNQACHQCRRRKLKCDAKRPCCSTCLRSHTHAVSHAPPGTVLPLVPECTFDAEASPDGNTISSDGPKNRYEKLENRISELEALLRQKENASEIQDPVSFVDSSLALDSASPGLPFLGSGDSLLSPSISSLVPSNVGGLTSPESSSALGLDLIWSNWPLNLPGPDLLRHLVEVFFIFHPHAHRLFHASTFMASLAFHPSHPRFPTPPVLHAICAVGSLYTAAVTSPPLPDFAKVPPDEIFLHRHRLKEDRPDSFAEQQAKFAKDTSEQLENVGQNLFQVLQAKIVLSWYFCSHAKWAELFVSSAHCLRVAIPLGLNICPPFQSITKSARPASILPPSRTVIEDEMRRNAFWLAYANERTHGCNNGWALCLDDQDVSQLLPVRGDQFEQGILVTPHDRQWAHSKDVILTHPENQVDSFILYVKGTIMISYVKTFNLRFRARHFAGDASVALPYSTFPGAFEGVDPRDSPAFIALDQVVSSFLPNLPNHLRTPINNNVIDSHLYTVYLMAHVANITLHEPHADVRKSGCISALKILTSSRAILDLIYSVCSTSYDITLLDPFCSFCWFCAGRVLVRFLQASIEANSAEQISTLRGEVDFIQSAMSKFGQRIPLAYRLAKMLEDLIVRTGGLLTGVSPNSAPDHSGFSSLYGEDGMSTSQSVST